MSKIIMFLVVVMSLHATEIQTGKKVLDQVKKKDKNEKTDKNDKSDKKSDNKTDAKKDTKKDSKKSSGDIKSAAQNSTKNDSKIESMSESKADSKTAEKAESKSEATTQLTDQEDDKDYKKLLGENSADQERVANLKYHMRNMVKSRNQVRDEIAKGSHSLPSNVFQFFDEQETKSNYAITDVRKGQMLNNVEDYAEVLNKIGEEFRGLTIEYKTVGEVSQGVSMIERSLSSIKGDLTDLKGRSTPGYSAIQLKEKIEAAGILIGEIKTKNSGLDVTKYKTELSGYETEFKTLESAGNSRQNMDDLLHDTWMKGSQMVKYPRGTYDSKEEAQTFYDQCKELNYPTLLKRIQAEVKDEETKKGTYVTYLTTKFVPEFNAYSNTYLIKDINAHIEKAYAEKAKGKTGLGAAVEQSEIALLLADASLLLLPDAANFQKLKKDAQAAVDKISGEAGAALYTSDFHKANKEKIIFSKSRIVLKNENAGTANALFAAGQNIYAMAYLKGTIKELPKYGSMSPKIVIGIWVDAGDEPLLYSGTAAVSAEYIIMSSNPKMSETTLELDLVPDPSQTNRPEDGAEFAKHFSQLSPRNHTIKVGLFINDQPFAWGSFELDCSEGQAKYAALAETLVKSKVQNARAPKAKATDKTIEQSMNAALKSEGFNIIRVIQTDPEWYVERHAITGIILNRTMQAAIVFKDDQNKSIVEYMNFTQDFDGNAYGKLYRSSRGMVMDPYEISFENVNK